MSDRTPWRPTRRRLTDALLASVTPVAVCGLALGGLSTWTAYGNAGTPPRVTVTDGRIFLPAGDTPETAAFFRITNSGGSADRLVKVTSTGVGEGDITLSRHVMTGASTPVSETVTSAEIPAGARLTMTPDGLDVIVPVKAGWQPGALVPFTLHFEHSAAVRTLAIVVRPGEDGT